MSAFAFSEEEARQMIAAVLNRTLASRNTAAPLSLGAHTELFGGPAAILDSLGWVVFCSTLDDEFAGMTDTGESPTSLLDLEVGAGPITLADVTRHFSRPDARR